MIFTFAVYVPADVPRLTVTFPELLTESLELPDVFLQENFPEEVLIPMEKLLEELFSEEAV